jgi:hypothetical protein
MYDWGDMLVAADFAGGDGHGAYYLDLRDAATFTQELGSGRLSSSAVSKLRGRGWRARLEQALAEHAPRNAVPVNADFEVIYGHAFKAVSKSAR